MCWTFQNHFLSKLQFTITTTFTFTFWEFSRHFCPKQVNFSVESMSVQQGTEQVFKCTIIARFSYLLLGLATTNTRMGCGRCGLVQIKVSLQHVNETSNNNPVWGFHVLCEHVNEYSVKDTKERNLLALPEKQTAMLCLMCETGFGWDKL